MPASITALAQINDLAKDYFTNVYLSTVNTATPLKDQFAALQGATFAGRKWIFGLKHAVGGGSANSFASATAGVGAVIPQATQGVYTHGEATLVRTYTRIGIDNFLVEITKENIGAFRPALAETMADRLAAHDLEVNRQLFCGGNGFLCINNDTANSQTHAVIMDYGAVNGVSGARHLNPGDVITAYVNSGGITFASPPVKGAHIAGTTTTITSVDQVGNNFTGSATANLAGNTNAIWTRAVSVLGGDPDTDNTLAGEANGLLASVADGTSGPSTFEAIVVANFARWKSFRLNNSGVLRDLTDSLVMQAIETGHARSRKLVNLAICRPGVVLKYSETFLPLRRIQGQDIQLKGGYIPVAGLQHAGGVVPVLSDWDCPDSRMFLINTDAFRMADLLGTQWFDGDGAIFSRIPDKDGVEGLLRKYWQLITLQRNVNICIEDLNDLSSIDRTAQ